MAASGAIAGSTRSTWLLALAAAVAFHAAAAVGVYLATAADRLSPPSADPAPERAPVPGAPPVPGEGTARAAAAPAPAEVVPVLPLVPELPPEVASAPPVPRTAPVVPLPADRDDAADALADLRRRRVEVMLEQQRRRAAR